MYPMPEYQDSGEPVLVALAQNGDQDALEVLLRRYYRPLRAFIAPLVGSSHADDVLQEIALAIFQNFRYLRHPGAFRSWAFRIASRRAFRHLKRETQWKLLENDRDAISSLPAAEPLPDTLEPGLLAVIEQVSPASRAVTSFTISKTSLLKKRRSFSDIRVGTAKSRLAYGVSVLRKRINQKGTR